MEEHISILEREITYEGVSVEENEVLARKEGDVLLPGSIEKGKEGVGRRAS